MQVTTKVASLNERPGVEGFKRAFAEDSACISKAAVCRGSSRSDRFTPLSPCGVFLDYSKNRVTDETVKLLIQLVEESGLRAHIDAMFHGERSISRRIAPYCMLRCARRRVSRSLVDGEDVIPAVHAVLDKMAAFADRVRSGEWKGHTGKRIRNVINIGIGGSDLGPVMAYEALKYYSQRDITFRFRFKR